MAIHRTRKNKEAPHYGFLVSWSPTQRALRPGGQSSQPGVKGELKNNSKSQSYEAGHIKKADLLAKEEENVRIKKDLIRSLILVGFILALELVIYLAWKRLMP